MANSFPGGSTPFATPNSSLSPSALSQSRQSAGNAPASTPFTDYIMARTSGAVPAAPGQGNGPNGFSTGRVTTRGTGTPVGGPAPGTAPVRPPGSFFPGSGIYVPPGFPAGGGFPAVPATGAGIMASEDAGAGADAALTTAYSNVPGLSLAVAPHVSVNVLACVTFNADGAAGGDALYCQIYDTVAGSAIAGSERHMNGLDAGQSGFAVLMKIIPASSAGRTLVVQVKNATSARGTVSPAQCQMQAVIVAS